jgi:hypothetical protein
MNLYNMALKHLEKYKGHKDNGIVRETQRRVDELKKILERDIQKKDFEDSNKRCVLKVIDGGLSEPKMADQKRKEV